MTNPFQLFGLPEQFPLDETALNTRYRELAAQFHPDRFAAASAFEQKQAVMMTAALNEAYRVLGNPLNRAACLLEKQGIHADAPEHTQFAPEFLMQQMEWREALAEARAENDTAALHALNGEIAAEYAKLLDALQAAFVSTQNPQQAAQLVRQGRFLAKMQQELAFSLPEN